MQIIKDRQIIDDNWIYVADETPVPQGDITISLQRWRAQKQELSNHNGRLGLRLTSTDNLADISTELDNFKLIELDFAQFTDGRSFSMATLLRERYHYGGEIRATGNFLRDQIFYLSRVGFNAFNPSNSENLEAAIAALDDFTVKYQKAID